MTSNYVRFDWTVAEITDLYQQPLDALIGQALKIKQENWPEGKIQKSQLLSIKQVVAQKIAVIARNLHILIPG